MFNTRKETKRQELLQYRLELIRSGCVGQAAIVYEQILTLDQARKLRKQAVQEKKPVTVNS